MSGSKPLSVFIVAGEKSGDDLGGKLIAALKQASSVPITFAGVGGEAMAEQGLQSLFPLEDIAVMGIVAVLARLPKIVQRVYQTVAAVGQAQPDVLVIIDSPDFTHAVAKRVRAKWPKIPVVDYVSPSVWAWRQGRARKMGRYIDHVLALLPFEPAAHQRLGGPPCTYVGHPLIERLASLRPNAAESARREAQIPLLTPLIVILPGSRRSEITHLMDDFGKTVALLARRYPHAEFVLPAVAHVEALILQKMADWPVKPQILRGESAKYTAFRSARAALAASGTVTLELALAQVPTVVAYKVSKFEEPLRYVIKVPSIVLPNLILGENAVPELLQEKCQPALLADALINLIEPTQKRETQIIQLQRLDALMQLPDGSPAQVAAQIVLKYAQGHKTSESSC